jgi:hypothetical protein
MFKSMVVDDFDVLEKEDLYILDRMKDFISTEDVSRFAAAKPLMILIERAVSPFHCLIFKVLSHVRCQRSGGVAMP